MLRELTFVGNNSQKPLKVRSRTVKSAESGQVICHGEISLRVFNSPIFRLLSLVTLEFPLAMEFTCTQHSTTKAEKGLFRLRLTN